MDNNIDSNEAAEQDASTIVYYTEQPTVGQQVVSALIQVTVPLAAGFGFLGVMAVGAHLVDKVKTRRAAKKAASLEEVHPTTSTESE